MAETKESLIQSIGVMTQDHKKIYNVNIKKKLDTNDQYVAYLRDWQKVYGQNLAIDLNTRLIIKNYSNPGELDDIVKGSNTTIISNRRTK